MAADKSIPILQKNLAHAAAVITGDRIDISFNIGHRPDPELYSFVCAAESTVVIGTTDGYRKQQASSFAGRADNDQFISHN